MPLDPLPVGRPPMPLVRSTGQVVEAAGPRPPLALTAGWIYAATGIVLLAGSLSTSRLDDVPLALVFVGYCAALAVGAMRLRSRSPRKPAPAWLCMPLIVHGLSGFLGAVSPWMHALGFRSDYTIVVAMFGMLCGWVATLFPFVGARRAGVLMTAGLAGPVALAFALQFVRIRL